MKSQFILWVSFLSCLTIAQAQTPPLAFNYSAVARDAGGNPIANQTIGIQINIIQNTISGPIVYSENHFETTDDFGLFNLIVGGGAVQSGSMEDIAWSEDTFFINVGMDASGGTNFSTMGTTQLLSVPYALHAKTAESLVDGTTPFSGDYNELTNAPTNVSAFVNDAGYVTADNIPQLSVSATGDTLYLSSTNWVIIPGISEANAIPLNPWLNQDLEYGTMTDQEGNTYATIVIGDQEWMAENLRTSIYRNGDPIPNIVDEVEWANNYSHAWAHYNNDSQYDIPYGKLYNGYAVTDPRNLCPTGWHVPAYLEVIELRNYLGGLGSGGQLKTTGTEYWLSPNSFATNLSGFSALPSGHRGSGYTGFVALGTRFTLWTKEIEPSFFDTAYTFLIEHDDNSFFDFELSYTFGVSVRCLRD
ncbi:MAG: fibrobacter succinogenes major paralogous domain-containing protein [Pseudomonadota bacterium]